MENFERKKLIEIVLHILNLTKGVTSYQLNKLLYFAERSHLANWGVSLVPTTFEAWDRGPVPRFLYLATKHLSTPEKPFTKELARSVRLDERNGQTILIATREADADYLSESAIEALNEAVSNYALLPDEELQEKSHDSAWEEARRKGMNEEISRLSMAKVLTQDEAMLEFIGQSLEIEDIFKNA